MQTIYTTETNGVNDLTAQRRHTHEVRRMALAAVRRPCPVHQSNVCGHTDDCDFGIASIF